MLGGIEVGHGLIPDLRMADAPVTQRACCDNWFYSSCPGLAPGIHVPKTASHKKTGMAGPEREARFAFLPGHDKKDDI
jgi:hypothetical protein